jgi:hypothetical protein
MVTRSDTMLVGESAAHHDRVGESRYLSPQPLGVECEYDYLANLRYLLEDAGLDGKQIIHKFFDRHLDERPNITEGGYSTMPYVSYQGSDPDGTEALMIDQFGSQWYLRSRTEMHRDVVGYSHRGHARVVISPNQCVSSMDWKYHQIRYIRQMLIGQSEQGTRVLVVQDINAEVLQILGAALDLDPCFLGRHLGSSETWTQLPEELKALGETYAQFLSNSKQQTGQNQVLKQHADSKDTGKIHISGHVSVTASPEENMVSIYTGGFMLETGAEVRRDPLDTTSEQKTRASKERLSCCRVSPYGCKLL